MTESRGAWEPGTGVSGVSAKNVIEFSSKNAGFFYCRKLLVTRNHNWGGGLINPLELKIQQRIQLAS